MYILYYSCLIGVKSVLEDLSSYAGSSCHLIIYMSYESSDEDEDVIIIHPLSWRSKSKKALSCLLVRLN